MSSINHHYIPQLYLRGFVADSGRLQVFDKKRNAFKKDKQTPRTVLFEKHRNTIKYNGINSDEIERLYSLIESPLGDFFNLIRKGISKDEIISQEGLYLIKLFIAIQFWRLPISDYFVDYYIDNLDLTKFGNTFSVSGVCLGETQKIKFNLQNNSGFRHYFRCFILPLITFDLRVHESEFPLWNVHNVSPDFKDWNNFLTGDNPLIIEDVASMFSFNSKFILPLSNNSLITFSPTLKPHINTDQLFTTYLCMVTYQQCHRYVVGTNREYMEQIRGLVNEFGESSNTRLKLFRYI
ncbi:TPA: DUF4238 domain-containing protein [Vibrio vulnificus]|uniref:DUF4238 domain-containing protein n=1 Tax=Vibrio vulnificus TaxID=672 RepID=UPI001A29A5A6|nr:DUF4238 domain-containing protein [Vibrio vulnificus]MCJ0806982.1 DUF4238 domain-containing protein [Vibrio vulnificus]HAS8349099.1 DUF4238 domain-containing protein [Vibrio vulnificus]HAS8510951.1 DUF4238 domain-containing protein [Vibrio vulnificus]HDY7531145.1 DUF4238 domain-containing protein [Vibrio vulnificus]